MEFEVRHWMTNHEADIGTWGRSTLPPAGLNAAPAAAAKPAADSGPVSGKPGTIGNIYYGPKGYPGDPGVRDLQVLAGRQ